MNENQPAASGQFTVVPSTIEVSPSALADASLTGLVLYLSIGVGVVLMGLLYNEIRALRKIAEALTARAFTLSFAVASETHPAESEASQ